MPDPLIEFCLLLNVLQSVDDNNPLLVILDVGRLRVITGVVVPVATLDDTSVPVVPNVRAATDVTVPEPYVVVSKVNVPAADELDKSRDE